MKKKYIIKFFYIVTLTIAIASFVSCGDFRGLYSENKNDGNGENVNEETLLIDIDLALNYYNSEEYIEAKSTFDEIKKKILELNLGDSKRSILLKKINNESQDTDKIVEMANSNYDSAKKYFNDGDKKTAKEKLKLALYYYPKHKEAQSLLELTIPSPEIVGSFYNSYNYNGLYIKDNYAFVTYTTLSGITGDIENSGLAIINISNKQKPELEGYCELPVSSGGVVFVRDNFAYVISYYEGLYIIDVSDKKNPDIILNYKNDKYVRGGEQYICVDNEYAYISQEREDALKIINLKNIKKPFTEGAYYPSVFPFRLDYYDNYVYLCCLFGGLDIIDVSDKKNPQKVSSIQTPWVLDVKIQDNYAYTADGKEGLIIYDISNKTAPFRVSELISQGDAYKIFVDKEYAYLVGNGFEIFDISDKVKPARIATLAVDNGGQNIIVDSGYAFIISNKYEKRSDEKFYHVEGGLRIVKLYKE